jgi:hypothetical protein
MEIRATPSQEGRREVSSQIRISDAMRVVYVLVVYQPGSRTDIRWRRISTRPWARIRRGRSVGDRRRRLLIVGVRRSIAPGHDCIEHILHAYTRAARLRGARPSNVVALPAGRVSATADFLRYQVLVRVFNGDADRWLDHLREQGDFADEDIRFVRWIRGRLRRDPELMEDIRRMVELTPLWRA